MGITVRQMFQRRVAGVLAPGAIALNGLDVQAGQLKFPSGTAAAPGLAPRAGLSSGIFWEGSRIALAFAGLDKQYWSAALNHNYQGVSVTGNLAATTLTGIINGLQLPTRSVTANHTVTADDFLILADPTAGNITITLPAVASSAGRTYCVAKTVAHANTVTVDPFSVELIDGAGNRVVPSTSALMFQCDGAKWTSIAVE